MIELTNGLTAGARERALLMGIAVWPEKRENAFDHLEELERLVDTAGGETVMKMVQGLHKPDVAHLIGKGKADELAALVEEEDISLIVVDADLSPVQTRNLERVIKRKVLDRSGLILDIFARHARSREARTQVELAQLQYLLPRLTRQWTHLSKQFGGIGTKGPGETQIETDRRLIRNRISHLREKLGKIETQRETQRKGRAEHFRVALVGYTNAGKSTLMNELSDAEVKAEDRLFATLDTTIRQVELSPGRTILLSDTVGFIRKLPSNLIASFRSTLAEAREADLLMHVVDVSSPTVYEQIKTVEETLKEIGATEQPMLVVLNKVDLVDPHSEEFLDLRVRFPESIAVSAQRGLNIQTLRDRLTEIVEATFREQVVRVPVARYHEVMKVHAYADVTGATFDEEYVHLTIRYNPKVKDHVEHLLALAHAEKEEL